MGNCCSRPDFTPITILRGKKTTSSEKFEQFTGLPDDLARQVFNDPSFSMKDKVAFARTSKRYYGLFRDYIHAAKCLMLVAHGKQEEANNILRENPQFLLERCDVTDYSGRTFKNITPYEYAYWAKDTHMCRMLESHMDETTKAKMLERIDAIERDGLNYWQYDSPIMHSKHFDFTPLITALRRYHTGYNNWARADNKVAMYHAWMAVGIAQRDMPVHVVNEYCHPSRTFNPTPEFNEEYLPRSVIFFNVNSGKNTPFFPLVISNSSNLGNSFALMRSQCLLALSNPGLHCWDYERVTMGDAGLDLAAIRRLDIIRSTDLTRSRELLLLENLEADHSMRV